MSDQVAVLGLAACVTVFFLFVNITARSCNLKTLPYLLHPAIFVHTLDNGKDTVLLKKNSLILFYCQERSAVH